MIERRHTRMYQYERQPGEVFQHVDEYLSKKFAMFSNDSGEYKEGSCGTDALTIAKMLLEVGANPSLLVVTEENGNTSEHKLYPRVYEKKVSWASHVVCALNGMVYDPIIGEPADIDEYLLRGFYPSESTLALLECFTPEKVRDMLKDWDIVRNTS